eukprot:gnl/Dysnectes_brevis/7254_a12006_186.p1 GENE.gnl/Dysnectes_brevis/7254_a12006_186~~gnl/Dysnectes_brevis/7254_a12006_186.p1  ORF type:complete len:416 (+),score=30.97 gnl/Dysnectes_brevis/7254_a12006_186:175-1248(+)
MTSIVISVVPGLDTVNQCISVDLDPIQLDPSNIDIILYGGASWLYDLVIDLIEDLVIDFLIDPLAQLIQQSAQDQLEEWIQNGDPVFVQPNGVSCVDRRSAMAPIVENGILTLPFTGMVTNCESGLGSPWIQQPMPIPPVFTDSFVQLTFDRALFNSDHYEHYMEGDYSGLLTADDLDDGSVFKQFFTVDALMDIIPGLSEYSGQNINIDIYCTDAPVSTVQPVALFTSFPAQLDILIDGESTSVPVMQLSVDIGCEGTLHLSTREHSWGVESCFSTDYSLYNITTTLIDTTVGPIEDVETLDQLVSLLAADIIAPWASQHSLEEELFCLETDYLPVTTSSVMYHDTFVVVAFDLTT